MGFKKSLANFSRNWLYPTLGAAVAGAYAAWEGGVCVLDDWVCFAKVAGSAAFGFLAVKFNPIGGKDSSWFVGNTHPDSDLPSELSDD
jgi:hypothetical protein